MRLFTLLFALVLTTLAVPAYGEDEVPEWTFIDTTNTGTKIYARSQDILAGRADDTAAKVWVRFDASRDNTITWQSTVSLYVLNCIAETYQAVQHTYYYRDGRSRSTDRPEQVRFIPPGSNVDSIKKMVCYTPAAAVDYR